MNLRAYRMSDKDVKLLEEIVSKKGDCLNRFLCERCPFRRKCLPTFLNKTTRATKAERMVLALETLTNAALLDEDIDDSGEYFDNRE